MLKKSKLNRRFRKKRRVGEFQELGFEIEVKFKSEFSETAADGLFFDFINLIEGSHLSFGGGSGKGHLQGFVSAFKKYRSPSFVQKEKLKIWLKNRAEIS